jgi:hypothetical protein
MIQKGLDAQLSRNLVYIFFLPYLFLRHHFHPTQKTSSPMNNEEDLTELTFSHGFSNYEVRF